MDEHAHHGQADGSETSGDEPSAAGHDMTGHDMTGHDMTGHDMSGGGHDMTGHDMSGGGHDMSGAGHDRHEGHSVAMFRDKFWLTLALTVPVVLLSHDISTWFGYHLPAIPGIEFAPAILGTIVFVYGGLVFLRGARGELQDRQPGMMTLISLAILVAFVTSWAGTLGAFEVEIWWELASLIAIMLLGHWLEMRSIAQARGALSALAELLPDTAERVVGDSTETVALAALAVGDVILVRPGGRVPADGEIVDGTADVDESMITGESRAIPKEPGDRVVAGTAAPCACRCQPLGTEPPSPGSCGWSRPPRHRHRGHKHSPIAPQRSCSMWPLRPALPPWRSGGSSAIPREPSFVRRPCS